MSKDPMNKLWQFKINDKTTWPYLDCQVSSKDGKPYIKKWIKNPDFKYKHLMKNYSSFTMKGC